MKVDADDAQVSRFAKRLASTYLQDAHMMEQAIVYAPDDYAADAMIKRAIRLRKFATAPRASEGLGPFSATRRPRQRS